MNRISVVLLSAMVTGCSMGLQTIDPRVYFSRSTPLEATMSFSWSALAGQWEHVSDCVVGPGPVSQEPCRELARYEILTDRKLARVEPQDSGDGVVLVVPFRADAAPKNGREAFTVYLVPESKVEGVKLWLIDVTRTVAANAPLVEAKA